MDEKWIKASILGTIWAASEIILGSFLHNIKVPFSGNILTAIALIILISVNHVWTEKGLFWRAGLICALMKTISPSAVIFEPMIAIFMEALLLEFAVRLFGRTFAGYFSGAVLAMSWNLFQKIASLIILYGYNIVNLYTRLIEIVQKQLNLNFDIVWMPVIILLSGQVILGVISAVFGIKIGRRLLTNPALYNSESRSRYLGEKQNEIKPGFNYSIKWICVDVLLIISSLVLLSHFSWIIWSSAVIAVVSIWALRYKKSFQHLLKPKFWLFFFFLTMAAAFAFTEIQNDSLGITNGLLMGIQMNFRAVVIIAGFSALGTELYNPKIRDFFMRTYFKQLPMALELSFESLPSIISTLPDFKSIFKNPVSVLYKIVSQAEYRLEELKHEASTVRKIFVLTGTVGQGKTTYVQKIIEEFKNNNITVGGIYQPRIFENNETIGYDVVSIMSKEREVFLRLTGRDDYDRIGKYFIYPGGLQKGIDALKISENAGNKIVVIDEVGKLELENSGWANSVNSLIDSSNYHLLLVIRDNYVADILRKWNLKQACVYKISDFDYFSVSSMILKHIFNTA